MQKFALDIETIPNTSMIDQLPEPEVLTGNLKDPEKIAAKIAEAKTEQINKMALNPFYGRIASFAWAGSGHVSSAISLPAIDDKSEKWLVEKIFDLLESNQTESPQIITWNGMGFDIPYIYKRALILKCEAPSTPMPYWCKRYTTYPHCDMMQIMSGWGGEKFIKLDTAASVILGEKKINFDVTKISELLLTDRNAVEKYNIHDAELTAMLYEKAKMYLF